MKRCKWHLILTLVLALIAISSFAACTKHEEGPNDNDHAYAPDFTLQTINGETVSLSDFYGKPVMLTFWSINCAACQSQVRHIQAFYDDHSSNTIASLTINVGDSALSVQRYANSHGVTYPVLLDSKKQVAQSYGIPGVPVTFLIDDKGIIKAYKIGAFRSQEEIELGVKNVLPTVTLNPEIETGPEIGNIAPDFKLPDINGQSTTLSEFRGKAVILNFWVSSCTACVDEMPYLQTVFDEQSNEDLIVIAVNCGENIQTVQSTVADLELSFPMLVDSDGKACTAYKRGAPTTFLIDDNGIIKAIKDEAFQNSAEIETMLNSL